MNLDLIVRAQREQGTDGSYYLLVQKKSCKRTALNVIISKREGAYIDVDIIVTLNIIFPSNNADATSF